jgi:hypothetical protein
MKGADMIVTKTGKYSSNRVALVVCLSFITLFLASCCLGTASPDGKFCANKSGAGNNIHYEVRETETDKVVFTTYAQYETPNDVKTRQFSSDSKKFAAAYHYSHDGSYTWIGVWSTETGEFLYSKSMEGFTTNLGGVFDN